jgi:hypothetical protein
VHCRDIRCQQDEGPRRRGRVRTTAHGLDNRGDGIQQRQRQGRQNDRQEAKYRTSFTCRPQRLGTRRRQRNPRPPERESPTSRRVRNGCELRHHRRPQPRHTHLTPHTRLEALINLARE